MNELTTNMFENKPIRIVNLDGDAWFVAKDVCAFFGDKNYKRSLRNLDEDEKGVTQMNTPGGNQELSIVSEGGLFRLLLQMKPQKARGVSQEYIDTRMKKLVDFQRWVTHEVLPSIRRTGSYSIPGQQPWYRLKPRFSWNDLPALTEEKRKLDRFADERDYVQAAINRVRYEEATKRLSPHDVERELFRMEQEHPYAIRKEEQHEQLPELPGGE